MDIKPIADVCIVWNDDYSLTHIGHKIQLICGTPEHTLLGTPVIDFWSKYIEQGAIDLINITDGQSEIIEGKWKENKYQREYPFFVAIATQLQSGIEDGAGYCMFSIVANNDNRLSKQQYTELLVEHAPVGISVFDEQGVVRYQSKALSHILGYAPDAMIGNSIMQYVHPDQIEEAGEKLKWLLANPGKQINIQTRFRHLNGTWRWLEGIAVKNYGGSEIEGIIVCYYDITLRKQLEDKISLTENQFISITRLLHCGLIMVRSDATIEFANDQALQQFGTSGAEIKKMTIGMLIPDLRSLVKRKGLTEEPGIDGVNRHIRCVKPGGATFYASVKLKKLLIHDTHYNIYTILADQEPQLIVDLASQDYTMAREGISKIASMASHDLRGPINNLSALSKLFDKDNPENPKNQLIFTNINKSVEQLKNTSNDLVSLLKLISKKPEGKKKVSIPKLIEMLKKKFKSEINKTGLEIETDFSKWHSIVAEPEYMELIVSNLFANGIQFADPKKSSILKLIATTAGDEKMLIVEDNGLGIDMGFYAEEVFGLYKIFHEGVSGKGLGLFTAQLLSNLAGGRIELESEKGKGSRFIVYLNDNPPL